jgi:Uma2 family endonuclease
MVWPAVFCYTLASSRRSMFEASVIDGKMMFSFSREGWEKEMTAVPNRPMMSVEEYLLLEQNSAETRYEYIDGFVRMLAGGTPDHAKIGANMIGVLYGLLEGRGCSVYTSDVRVCLSETRYVYPDVSVSCEGRDQEQGEMIYNPCLIIEVLSASTEAYDRGRKLAYYRECEAVQEYVLVDSQIPSVEIFRRGKPNLWTYHAFGKGDEVEFASLGIRFPLGKIYRNVVFSEEKPSI